MGPAADGLTPKRLDTLPPEDKTAWREYVQLSREQMDADRFLVYAELERERLIDWRTPPQGEGVREFVAKPASWFAKGEAQRLCAIVRSYQTPAGGWGKNLDLCTRARSPGERFSAGTNGWAYAGTFDNGATTTELRFLARVVAATNCIEARESFERGLAYVLRAQFPNGGWPQVYPLAGGYHDAITFNDNATSNVLRLLRDVARGRGEFAFTTEPLRGLAAAAVARGVGCVLATQVRAGDQLTAWGQQHDPLTFAPTSARDFEMIALASAESAGLLRFLMEIESPGPEVIAAVGAAAVWLRETAIEETVWEQVKDDKQLVKRPGVGPLWARFYEIGTNRPLFGDRDGAIHTDVQEISRERRVGYAWYSAAPRSVLEKYERWSAEISRITP
jgi:PelA/Pel-15E family pectate lyase